MSLVDDMRRYRRLAKRRRRTELRDELAAKVMRYLKRRNGQAKNTDIAKALGVHPKRLGRVVKEEYGLEKFVTTTKGNKWVHWVLTIGDQA